MLSGIYIRKRPSLRTAVGTGKKGFWVYGTV